MNEPDENLLKVSFAKALLVSSVSMLVFVIVLFAMGMPSIHDPLFWGFLFVMIVGMPFAFAGFICFMGRCKVEEEGLRGTVPWGYQRVLRWDEINHVRGNFPFYTITGRGLGEFCIVPYKFLMKQPERMDQLIGKFAPRDNILRRRLGLDSARLQ
jgi:hypothetical protein